MLICVKLYDVICMHVQIVAKFCNLTDYSTESVEFFLSQPCAPKPSLCHQSAMPKLGVADLES